MKKHMYTNVLSDINLKQWKLSLCDLDNGQTDAQGSAESKWKLSGKKTSLPWVWGKCPLSLPFALSREVNNDGNAVANNGYDDNNSKS